MLNFRFNQPTTALLASLTLVGIASCSTPSPEASAPTNGEGADTSTAGEVNIYSSRHYDTDDQLYDEFTAQTGIEVNLIEGKATELIERMQTEGENSPADVLITVDVGNLWRAQDSALLQAVDSDVLNQAVPATFRDDEGHWFALTKRARVIVYNRENVDPSELSTYAALADEEWRDRICMRSSNNIYNQSLVAAKIAELGEDETQAWVEGLVANFARDPEGNDVSQLQSVAAGECDVTIANTYYVGRLIRSDDPADQEVAEQVGLFFPDAASGGTHVNISGAGVARHAPNAENAIAFLEFMVTPEAQEVFASGNNEYPVVPEVAAHEVVKGLGDFEESELKVEEYGELNATAVKVMDRAGWK